MIEQKISMHELSQLFRMNYETPEEFDLSDMGLMVQSSDSDGNDCYKEIQSFIVKPSVNSYYQLGDLKGTNKHRVLSDGEFISLENHKDSVRVSEPMNVVDIMVDDTHTYHANGQLNHNTTSGGMLFASTIN